MASYLTLYDLRDNSDLQDKVAVACMKKAQSLIDAGNLTANAKQWVNETLGNPRGKALEVLDYVLAANSSATEEDIRTASDSTIQTNVNDAVDALIA